jgi:hypothetical protein
MERHRRYGPAYAWFLKNILIGLTSESPELVPRLLEVVKGRVCYIIGTVYMDMPLKPNVLEDLARDVSYTMLKRLFHTEV